jgi:CO/xanthine dehydrogenase Mo-binding subunit
VLRGRGLGFSRYKNRGTYAAVMVEVELDTEIRVRRAWAAVDAGTVVSRSGLLNQSEGGIVQATVEAGGSAGEPLTLVHPAGPTAEDSIAPS